MKPLHILFSVLAGAASLSLAGCSGGAPATAGENKDTTVAVRVARPSGNSLDGVSASGQVEAVNTASISTRLMGTITNIYVRVGDKVRAGQLLVTVSSDELAAKKAQAEAQIAGAQANLDNARKDYDRYTALFGRQSATASELDNATLRFHTAASQLDAAREMRREIDASAAYARLTAPFQGVVTQKLVDAGSLATPGTPILVLEQEGRLRVNATVAESDISRIKTGDRAQVEIKSTGLTATGSVEQISVSSVATGGQYQVKIALPQEMQKSVYAGMYVNVFIPVKMASTAPAAENGAVLVPASALVEKDQLTGIYTISNRHTALLRWVRTGKRIGDKVEVLSGLDANESFITDASDRLYNGVPVVEK